MIQIKEWAKCECGTAFTRKVTQTGKKKEKCDGCITRERQKRKYYERKANGISL